MRLIDKIRQMDEDELAREVYWKEFYEEKATKLQNEMARMERNKK